MPRLIVAPQAGFGNRLRTMCNGVLFGLLTDREVYHYWVRDPRRSSYANVTETKNFDPSTLFDLQIPLFPGDAVDVCFSEWLPGDHWYEEQSTAQTMLRCGRLERLPRLGNSHDVSALLRAEEDVILLETSMEVHAPQCQQFRKALMTEIYNRYFPLQPRWQSLLQQLPSFDYGFSIRRGAFLNFFPGSDVGIEQLAAVIDRMQGSKIIFSDDDAFAAELRASVGSPLSIGAEASGLRGMEGYIAQFLTLSKCRDVYGTKDSSFAEQAALFGGRSYHTY